MPSTIPVDQSCSPSAAARLVGCSRKAVGDAVHRGEIGMYSDAGDDGRVDIRQVKDWAAGRTFGKRGRPPKT